MLEVEMECKKGFLFIRLNGSLTKDTRPIMQKEVNQLVNDNKIRNIVFNVEQVKEIDEEGMKVLYENYLFCQKENGLAFLCPTTSKICQKIKKYTFYKIHQIQNERSAFAYL